MPHAECKMTAFLGCLVYGALVSRRGRQGWRIRRQYLCQSAVLVCGLSLLSLTTLEVEYTVQYLCQSAVLVSGLSLFSLTP